MSNEIEYPASWQESELGNISELITDGAHFSPSPQEYGELIVNVKDLTDNSIDFENCTKILKKDFDFLIRQNCSPKHNDILLSKDGTIGKVVLFDKEIQVVLLSSIAIIRLENHVYPDFVKHVLKSFIFDKQLYALQSGSALKRIVLADIKQLKVTLPSYKAQNKIANILNTVDNLIDQTQNLIDKYTFVKKGMMSDLFSRGIDLSGTPETNKNYGQLRPSYAEAPELYQETDLGVIPNDWAIHRIENILDRVIDYRGKTPNKTDHGIPLITAKNVRFGYIDPEPREFIATDDYDTWMTRGIPNQGDVLFTTEAPLANVAQLGTQNKVAFAQRMIILQAGKKCDSTFLKYLLMSENFRRTIFSRGSGSTVEGVKQSEFKKVKVCIPCSNSEQVKIAEIIDSLAKKIDNEEMIIDKYQDIKKGLMQDLLTGKVTV